MGPHTILLNDLLFKWALSNNIDQRGPGPLNLIFVNQFLNAPYNDI